MKDELTQTLTRKTV